MRAARLRFTKTCASAMTSTMALGVVEFDYGRLAVFYASRTMAHGHGTQTEIIGTSGALSVGRNLRANRVKIADQHGMRNVCTLTFFERFEDAFLRDGISVG